jgi:hypothetical protein
MASKLPSMSSSPCKISSKSINRLKSDKVESSTELKIWHSGRLQCRHLPTRFHENPPIGSKVSSGDTHRDTHRQAGDLTSLLSFLILIAVVRNN